MMRRFALLSALTLAGLCPAHAQAPVAVQEPERILRRLVESYGVSGMEDPVRQAVREELPAWATSETDSAGNLIVRAGHGDPLVVFVAHLDEIGFRVTDIRPDGQLELAQRGGFLLSLYEGRPALVHTGHGTVAGVFTPRERGRPAVHRAPGPPRVDLGTSTRAATESLGVRVGQTVTMPKEYVRLAGTRATGRSFDDRVGDAALLLALRTLDRTRLHHEVMFIWSVREETGLEGARVAAEALGSRPARVHAVDTFVSADSPLELPNFAVARLGAGPVIRALDNSSVTPPALSDSLLALARAARIPLSAGSTNGGNDGSVFARYGVPDVALGWPLRYSHSPAEVIDLRDLAYLAAVVRVIAERW